MTERLQPVARRGYHLDCKGGFPPLPALYEFCRDLIALGIDCFLIEYEDRFPYPSFPELSRADSPSLAEWREFLAWVRNEGVTPIPLVQTAGHLEYLLRHERFAQLAEDGNVNEACLSNPATRTVVKQLLDDVLAVHAGDPYVHIGADETWFLATCPVCRERLARGLSKLEIYCEHVGEIAGHVKARGFRPMMWCDMFWRGEHPELVRLLPRDTILTEWVYSGQHDGAPGCYWAGRYTWSDRYAALHPGAAGARTAGSLDAPAREFLERWWPVDPVTGLGPVSPYTRYFQAEGFEVWGVSAARSGEQGNRFGMTLKSRVENVRLWAREGAAVGLGGVIMSSWSRASTFRPLYAPWASARLALTIGALAARRPDADEEKLLTAAAEHLFGVANAAPVRRLIDHFDGTYLKQEGGDMAHVEAALAELRAVATRGHDYLELLALAAAFNHWRPGFEAHLGSHEGAIFRVRRGMMPAKGRGNFSEHREGSDHLRAALAGWRERLRSGLAAHFRPDDLEEYIDSRLGDLEFRLANCRKALNLE